MANTPVDLNKLTKEKLLAKAKRMKTNVSSAMKKDEIIKAIAKAQRALQRIKKAAAEIAKKRQISTKKAGVKAAGKGVGKKAAPKVKTKSVSSVSSAKKAASKKAAATAKPKTTAKPKRAVVSKPEVKTKTAETSVSRQARKPVTTPVKAVPSKPGISNSRKPVEQKAKNWVIEKGEKKFFIACESEEYAATESGGIPEGYGDTRIVILARDPRKLYAYWETSKENVEQARLSLGKGWSDITWALRIYDMTGIEFDLSSARSFFDINIDPASNSRYVDIKQPDREYIVAVGLIDSNGNFAAITVSNRVRTPRAEISESCGEGWDVPDETFLRLYGLSGGGQAGLSSLGGSELSIPMEEISSGAVSSFGASEQMPQEKERGFSFWLNCELIVYGGTEPDAVVTMMGKQIQLRPDGTFSARFALPDGVMDIPVTALSGDRIERREISPTVSRTTRVSKEKFPEVDEEAGFLSKTGG